MALSSRYTFDFQTVLDGETHSINIKQEGYGGSPEALPYLPGRDFMTLSYDKSNPNYMHPVRGSQLTLNISLEPSQIQEFVLADNRTWYIEWTSASGWEWYGWMQPQPSVNYNPYGLRELSLQFSDNLGSLQNTPDNVMDSAFVELQPFSEMIERELGLTDISLPVTISTSVRHLDYPYETGEETAHLEQSMTLDFNGQQPQKAYDILSKLLRMLHCFVFQYGGQWVVTNPIDNYLAGYIDNLFTAFQIADRGLNVRFEAPLSKTTSRGYHYQIRHTQQNRDFHLWVPSGPNKGFTNWEQVGTLATEMFDLTTISGKNYFKILGNYVVGTPDSTDYYMNDGGSVSQGEMIRVYLNYEYTFAGAVDARVAIINDVSGTIYYLTTAATWTTSLTILTGDADINAILNLPIPADDSGNISIRIYRPAVASLPGTYNPTTSYMRFAYAEVLASKTAEPTDLKLFKSIGLLDNRGLREDEKFETMGLQYDREFSPNGSTFWQYSQYVSFIFDSTGSRLDSKFISDYDSDERALTEFAVNTFMRLFAKTQIYIEVELYGKALRIGDIYTADIPGLPSGLSFIVVAYEWNVQADRYSATLAYIEYDTVDTIGMQRFWLQQSQEDTDG